MPSVQIQLVLDGDKGVITGLRAVGGELDAVGKTGKTATSQASDGMAGFEKKTLDAHAAAQLFVRTTGVEMPRALEGVIARSQILGPLLKAALPIAIFSAAVPVLGEIYAKFGDITNAVGGYSKNLRDAYDQQKKLNIEMLEDPRTPAIAAVTLLSLKAQLAVIDQRRQKEEEIADISIGDAEAQAAIFQSMQQEQKAAGDTLAIELQRQKVNEKLGQLALERNRTEAQRQGETALIGKEGFAAIAQRQQNAVDPRITNPALDPAGAAQAVVDANAKAAAEITDLRKKLSDDTRKLVNDEVLAHLDGIDKIWMKEQQTDAELQILRDRDAIDDDTLDARRVANHLQAEAQITAALMDEADKRGQTEQEWLDLSKKTMDDLVASSLGGVGRMRAGLDQQLNIDLARVDADTEKALQSLEKQFDKLSEHWTGDQMTTGLAQLTADEVAIIKKGEDAKDRLRQEDLRRQQAAADETQTLNEKAAVAMLPPWQQADAAIVADYQDAQRKLAELRERGAISAADYDHRLADEAVLANAKMANDLATSLQSTFDAITSGTLGQTILKNFEKFFFQIAAQWLITTGTMKEYSSLLGPLLGINIPGAVGGGAGLGGGAGTGTAALTALLTGGSTTGAASGTALTQNQAAQLVSALGLGGGSTTSAMTGTGVTPFLGAGAGSIGPGGIVGGANNTGAYNVDAVNQLLGVPSLSGAALAGSGSKGLLGSLSAMGPMLAMMGGGYLGGKLGGTPGMLGGGLLASLLYQGIKASGAGWAASLGVLPGGALVGAGAGLLGFGVGQQYGTAAGIGTGAASGLLMGLALGLPGIGTAIAAVIGLLGGLFGGLFGGSQRQKQADAFVAQQKTAADQIEAQFKSFQVDYPTALTDLEQIRTNAYTQLRQLKDEGSKDYSRNLSPYIDKLEAELKGYEDERDRRSTLAFAPPQFATGGTVMGYGGFGVNVIAHAGEEIINPQASAPLLIAFSSGADVSTWSGDLHVHGPLIQANRLDEAWLRNGGAEAITAAIRRARLEGRSHI